MIASWTFPGETARSLAASGKTGTRMCIARVPEAVTATSNQNGGRLRLLSTGIVNQRM